MLTGRNYLIGASALAAIIFITANLLFQPLLSPARIDFTEHNLYTLSDGTRTVLNDLSEPVDITFVYTRSVGQEYPAVRAYAARVRELLDVYASASGGKLRVREIDPAPFSTDEDEALAAGITAVDTDGNDPLYFGLIGRNAVDDERVIPFLAPERETSLEYNLTRLIDRLDNPAPARIGVLSGLQGMSGGGDEAGYSVLREISESYEIAPISPDFQSLPEGMKVILMAHPPELTLRQSWLIDQFLMRGGRALILVDPASKASLTASVFDVLEPRQRSDLGIFSKAWGVLLSMEAVADVAGALPVNADGGAGRDVVIEQPLFIGASTQDMNHDSVITADLGRAVNFGSAGALITENLPQDVNFTPLIRTGPSPSWIDAAKAARDMSPQDVLAAYEGLGAPLVLAGQLSGPLASAFPAGPPALTEPDDPVIAEIARAEAANALPHIAQSETDVQIVIIADTDLLDDGFYINPQDNNAIADNGVLILNALDSLASQAGLSSLRARAPGLRPMTRVENMRSEAQDKFFGQQARLEEKLSVAQARLEELQAIGSSGGFFSGDLAADLTDEERAELQQLRSEIVEVRGRLRAIERDFRHDIDRLEGSLKAVNIWSGPLMVGLIGLFVWYKRRRNVRRPS